MPAREWMRICFELLEMLKAHKKGIRRATVNTFGYIAKVRCPPWHAQRHLIVPSAADDDPAAWSTTAHCMAATACCEISASACLDLRMIVRMPADTHRAVQALLHPVHAKHIIMVDGVLINADLARRRLARRTCW